jgi:hypothetical protein
MEKNERLQAANRDAKLRLSNGALKEILVLGPL